MHDLFLESMKSTSKFLATPCASYDEVLGRRCTQVGPLKLMAGDVFERITGVFYIATNSKTPFAMQRFDYNEFDY